MIFFFSKSDYNFSSDFFVFSCNYELLEHTYTESHSKTLTWQKTFLFWFIVAIHEVIEFLHLSQRLTIMSQLLILVQVVHILLIVDTLRDEAKSGWEFCFKYFYKRLFPYFLTDKTNDYITDLSLHRIPLQDFVFWCHLGVILANTPVY